MQRAASPLSLTPTNSTTGSDSAERSSSSSESGEVEVEEETLVTESTPNSNSVSPTTKALPLDKTYRTAALGAFDVTTTVMLPPVAAKPRPKSPISAPLKPNAKRQRKVGIKEEQVVLLDFGEDVEAEEAEERRNLQGEGEVLDDNGRPKDSRAARVVSSSILAAESTAHPVAKLLARFSFEYPEEEERAERTAYMSLTSMLCGDAPNHIFRNPDEPDAVPTTTSFLSKMSTAERSSPQQHIPPKVSLLAEREEEQAFLKHMRGQKSKPPVSTMLDALEFRKALWMSLNSGRFNRAAEQALRSLSAGPAMFSPSQVFVPSGVEEERLAVDVADKQSIRELRLVQFVRNLKKQAPVSMEAADGEAAEAALRRAGVQGWNLTSTELAVCEAADQFMNIVGVAEGLGQPYAAESGDGRNRHLMARYGIAHFKRETDRKILEYKSGDGDPRSIAGSIVLRHRIPSNYAATITRHKRDALIRGVGGSRATDPSTTSANEVMVATPFGAVRKRAVAGGAAAQAGGGEQAADAALQFPVESGEGGSLRTVMDLSDLHEVFNRCTQLQLSTAHLLLDDEARDMVSSNHKNMTDEVRRATEGGCSRRESRRDSVGSAMAMVLANKERKKSINAGQSETPIGSPRDPMDEAAAYISRRQAYLEAHCNEINCSYFVRGISVYVCALTAMQVRVGLAEKELADRRKAALHLERKIREFEKSARVDVTSHSASFRSEASIRLVSPAAGMSDSDLHAHRTLCHPDKFEALVHRLRIRYKRAMMRMVTTRLKAVFEGDVDDRVGGDNEDLFDAIFGEGNELNPRAPAPIIPKLTVEDTPDTGVLHRVDSSHSQSEEGSPNAVARKRLEAARRKGRHAKRVVSYGATDQAIRTASVASIGQERGWGAEMAVDDQFGHVFAAMAANSPLYSFDFDGYFRDVIDHRMEATRNIVKHGNVFSDPSASDSESQTSSDDEEGQHAQGNILLDEVCTSPLYFYELSKRIDFMSKGERSSKKGLYMLFRAVDSSDRRRVTWTQFVNFLFEAALVERKGAIDLDRKDYELAETVVYGRKSFIPTGGGLNGGEGKPIVSLLQRRRQQRERYLSKSANTTTTVMEPPQNLSELFFFRPTGQLIVGGIDFHIVTRTRATTTATAEEGMEALAADDSPADSFPVRLTVPTPRDALSKHPLYSVIQIDYNEGMRVLAVSCTDSTVKFYLVSGSAAAGSEGTSGTAVLVPKLIHSQNFDCNQTSIAFFKDELFCGGRDGGLTCLQVSYRFSRGFTAIVKPQQNVRVLGQQDTSRLHQAGRQQVSFYPHDHVIRRIIVVRHESCIVTCSFDHKMLMIDTRSLRVVHTFSAADPVEPIKLALGPEPDVDDLGGGRSPRQVERQGIVDVAYSEMLNVLVSISFAGPPLVWSLSTLNRCKPNMLVDNVRPHTNLLVSVQCIDYNHRTSATLDKGGMVKLWDIKELRCLQTIQLGNAVDRGMASSAVDAAVTAEVRLKKEQFRKAAVSSALKTSFGGTGSGSLESIGGGETGASSKANRFVKLIHHYDPPSTKTPLGEHVLYVIDSKRLYTLRYNYSQSKVILRNTADDKPILTTSWCSADQCYMTIAPNLTRVWDGDTSAIRDTFHCSTVEECRGATSGCVHPSGRQYFVGCADGSVLAKNAATGITLCTRRCLHTLPFYDDRLGEVTNSWDDPHSLSGKGATLPVRQILYCASPRPRGQGSDPSLDVIVSLSDDLVVITDGRMRNAFALTAPTPNMTRSLYHPLPNSPASSNNPSASRYKVPGEGVLVFRDANDPKKGLENPRCMAFDGEHTHVLAVGDAHGCITLYQLGRSQAPCRSGPIGITVLPKVTPRAFTCICIVPVTRAAGAASDADACYLVAADDEGAMGLFSMCKPFSCLAVWKHVAEDKPTHSTVIEVEREVLGSLHDLVPLRPPQVTCMHFYPEKSLLYVGDDAGKITIYNLAGAILFVKNAMDAKSQAKTPKLSPNFTAFGASTTDEIPEASEPTVEPTSCDINPFLMGSAVSVVNRWAAHLDSVTSINVVSKITTISNDLEKMESLFSPVTASPRRYNKSTDTPLSEQRNTPTIHIVSSSLDHCVYGWSVGGSTYLGALEQYGRCVLVPPPVVELVRRLTALESLQRVALLDRRYLKGTIGLPEMDEAIAARGSVGDADLFLDPVRVADPCTDDFAYLAFHREAHQRDARIDQLKVKRRGLVRSVGMRCVTELPHNIRTIAGDTFVAHISQALLSRFAANVSSSLSAGATTFATVPGLVLAAAEGSSALYATLSRSLTTTFEARARGVFGFPTLQDSVNTNLYAIPPRRPSRQAVAYSGVRDVFLAGVPVAPSAYDPRMWSEQSDVCISVVGWATLPAQLKKMLISLPLPLTKQLVGASSSASCLATNLWEDARPLGRRLSNTILSRSARAEALRDITTVHGAIQRVCQALQDAELKAEGFSVAQQMEVNALREIFRRRDESATKLTAAEMAPLTQRTSHSEGHAELVGPVKDDIVADAKEFIATLVGQRQIGTPQPQVSDDRGPVLVPNRKAVPAKFTTAGEQAPQAMRMMEVVEEFQRRYVLTADAPGSTRPSSAQATSGLSALSTEDSLALAMLFKRGAGGEWVDDEGLRVSTKKRALFKGNGLQAFPTGTFDLCDISRPELVGQPNSPRSDTSSEDPGVRSISLPTRARPKKSIADRQRHALRTAGDLTVVTALRFSEVEEERRKNHAAALKRREQRRQRKRYEGALEPVSSVMAIRPIDSDEEQEIREHVRGELAGSPYAVSHRSKGIRRGGSFTTKAGARMQRLLLNGKSILNVPSISPSRVEPRDHPLRSGSALDSLSDVSEVENASISPNDDSSSSDIDPKWFLGSPTECPALDRVDQYLDNIRAAVGARTRGGKSKGTSEQAQNVTRAVTNLRRRGLGDGHAPSLVVFAQENGDVSAFNHGDKKKRLNNIEDRGKLTGELPASPQHAQTALQPATAYLKEALGLITPVYEAPVLTPLIATTIVTPTSHVVEPTENSSSVEVHLMRTLRPRRSNPIGAAWTVRKPTKRPI